MTDFSIWKTETLGEPVTTVSCSTMHCNNQVVGLQDPARPPFCEKCKANKKG